MHSPLEAPSRYFDKRCDDNRNRQLYHGMTTALDEGVGNVTGALQRTGMYDNTLIVYSLDNGGYLGNGGDDLPFRGGKFSDFQVSVRETRASP